MRQEELPDIWLVTTALNDSTHKFVWDHLGKVLERKPRLCRADVIRSQSDHTARSDYQELSVNETTDETSTCLWEKSSIFFREQFDGENEKFRSCFIKFVLVQTKRKREIIRLPSKGRVLKLYEVHVHAIYYICTVSPAQAQAQEEHSGKVNFVDNEKQQHH